MDKKEDKNVKTHCSKGGTPSCAVYGLGVIGALVYYFQHAVVFSDFFWGLCKAIVWPAMAVYKMLELLHF